MDYTLSQKLAENDNVEFSRSSTNFSNTTMSDGASNAEDKDLVEKLMVQLKEKDTELKQEYKQFGTPHSMFYPPPFGYPFPPCSSGHLPMPIYQQQNEVQTVIIKDNTQEISADAKDGSGIYRSCLVCGDNNKKCGKNTGTGLQVCTSCRDFFKRLVESGRDKKATFQCSQGSENCLISKETRNSCEYCRFQACLKAGMDRQKIVELKAKREPEDAKDGIYRNCLVCGDQNIKCGKHTGTGLQVCQGCKQFFKRVVKSSCDKKATFQCLQGSGNCLISKETRNSCEYCRFQACLKAGMDRQKTVELKAKREQEKQKGSGNDS